MNLIQEKHQASCNKSRRQYSAEISRKTAESKNKYKSCFTMQQVTLRFPQTYDCLPLKFLLLDYKFIPFGVSGFCFVLYNVFTGAQL